MKEETLNKILEDINDALWNFKNNKCNVDTKEKGWDTYYGLDIELIDYIRKNKKKNKKLKETQKKTIDYFNGVCTECYLDEDYNIDLGLVEYGINMLKGENDETI